MQYDFNLPAGGAYQIDVKGRFFKYRSGTGAIRVRASKGGYVDLLPGQGVWSLDYDSLTVQDRSGAQNVGVIVAGDFDFRDDRITGTVEVIDGGKRRTVAGQAFSGKIFAGPVPGNYPHIQLKNMSVDKMLVVKQLQFYGTTNFDVFHSPDTLAGASIFMPSKMIGGPNSIAARFYQSNMAVNQVAANAGKVLLNSTIPAGGNTVYKLEEPIVIMPGFGITASGGTVGDGFGMWCEISEDYI